MTTPTGNMPPPIDDELLSAYLDGAVTPAERERVEASIATDPALRERATDLRATVALLRTLPQPVPRRTFVLTAEQATAIRPPQTARITRLFPTVAALSAVAAVLALALLLGDLATGGFSTKQAQPATSRSVVESAPVEATMTSVAVAAAAPTVAAAPAAAAANAPSAAGTITARSAGAAPQAAATPAATTAASNTFIPPATPTTVAAAQPPPPADNAAPSSGATVPRVTTERHRVPVALVRTGEIVLGLLALAGIVFLLLSRRATTRRA